jgi:DNA-binding MarR family transcriptional regulator
MKTKAVNNDTDAPMTVLLRIARKTYGAAMIEALKDAGCADMPRNGMYIIGGIARTSTPLNKLVKQTGASKQAASQLVDSLFEKGYIERSINPTDRRKLDVTLTERGTVAALCARAASDNIDKKLQKIVGKELIISTRKTLVALIDMYDEKSRTS